MEPAQGREMPGAVSNGTQMEENSHNLVDLKI